MIQVLKRSGIAGHQGTIYHLCHSLADFLVCFKNIHGIIVVFTVHITNCIRPHAEDINIVHTDLLTDFNIRTVHRSDGHSTVHHKLHVAGTAGLFARCGQLFRYLSCRNQHFCTADIIIFKEYDLQHFSCSGMFFNKPAQCADHSDNLFCTVISGTGLGTEYEYARLHCKAFVIYNTVIQYENMQRIQHLTFVFMQTFGLYVKDKRRIYDRTLSFFQHGSKTFFIMILDFREFLSESSVVGIWFQFAQAFRVFDPLRSNRLTDQICQFRIAAHQPAAVCDSVCNR